jgi:hypothetical protein
MIFRVMVAVALAFTFTSPGLALANRAAKAPVAAKQAPSERMKPASGALRRQMHRSLRENQPSPSLAVTKLRFTSDNGTSATAVAERTGRFKQEVTASKINGRWQVKVGRLQNMDPGPDDIRPLH